MGPPAGETGTTLFTHEFSPYALRVQIAMVEKGIPFSAVVVDLKNKPKELVEANPVYGKVPTLVHDGNSIAESLIMLEYLDEAFPETVPLLPKDPVARSKCRFWADYIYKGGSALMAGVRAAPGSPEKAASVETYVKYLKTIESAMAEYSKEGPFFCGDKFGYLDVILAPTLLWGPFFRSFGFAMPVEELPRLQMCIKAISEQKSVKETLTTPDKLQAYMAKTWGIAPK